MFNLPVISVRISLILTIEFLKQIILNICIYVLVNISCLHLLPYFRWFEV